MDLTATRSQRTFEYLSVHAAAGFEYANPRCRMGFQLEGWADGTRHEIAAAVGTHPAEFCLRAIAAEGALKRADNRFGGFRRKVFVAALAVGAQLKHRTPSLMEE